MGLGRVAQQAHRQRLAAVARLLHPAQGLVHVGGLAIEVSRLDAPLDPSRIHLHHQGHALVHGDGQGLGPAHAAQPGGEDHPAPQRAIEPLGRALGQRLVRSLQDPLGPDVDPRAGRHLSVHGQAGLLQLPEGVPVGPLRNEHGVRDQHPGSHLVGPEHADRFPGLNEEGLVGGEPPEGLDDGVEVLPRPRHTARSAVHHEVLRALRHVGVEVVHQHAQGGLLRPRLAGQLVPPGSPDLACAHRSTSAPIVATAGSHTNRRAGRMVPPGPAPTGGT